MQNQNRKATNLNSIKYSCGPIIEIFGFFPCQIRFEFEFKSFAAIQLTPWGKDFRMAVLQLLLWLWYGLRPVEQPDGHSAAAGRDKARLPSLDPQLHHRKTPAVTDRRTCLRPRQHTPHPSECNEGVETTEVVAGRRAEAPHAWAIQELLSQDTCARNTAQSINIGPRCPQASISTAYPPQCAMGEEGKSALSQHVRKSEQK